MDHNPQSQLKLLIAQGKEQGYLTYAEVNDSLPEELVDADQIEDIIQMINDMGIQVLETAPDADDLMLNETITDEDVVEEATQVLSSVEAELGRTTDPVRMYMREMGSVELLTREGEIDIAKRIEEGINEVQSAVAAYPEAITYLIEQYESVENGSNGGDFGNQAVDGDLAVLGIGDFQAVLIEGGQGADYADHHCHGVGVAAETAEEPGELFVHHGMAGYGVDEGFFLFFGGELAVNQQIADFKVVAVFGKLLDGIAAIVEQAFVAVDKGDFGFAAGGGHKPGIEGEHVCALLQRPDVDDIVA